MEETRKPQGSADALDEALAAALTQALSSNPEGGLTLTKSARLRRHRGAIVALRAKHWSWEQIAAMLAGAGLAVSARTVRAEMTAPKKSTTKNAVLARDGDLAKIARRRVAAPSIRRVTNPAAAPAAGALQAGQSDDTPPTESGFFTIDLEDN